MKPPRMARIVGVIPARWGSVRFPGKPLVPVAGVPLIVRVWRRVCEASRLDAVTVATDDARIADAVRAAGGEVVMTRGDHPSGTDRVAEAVAGTEAAIVINVQGDEPLIDPGLIDRLAAALDDDPAWGMVTAACPLRSVEGVRSPDVVKAVVAADGAALYFSRAPVPFARDGLEPVPEGLYRRHLGIYGYRREVLERLVAAPPGRLEETEKLEQLRALALGIRIRVLDTDEAGRGVDTPADVDYVERILARRDSGRMRAGP